jgi:hypothetical protein
MDMNAVWQKLVERRGVVSSRETHVLQSSAKKAKKLQLHKQNLTLSTLTLCPVARRYTLYKILRKKPVKLANKKKEGKKVQLWLHCRLMAETMVERRGETCLAIIC